MTPTKEDFAELSPADFMDKVEAEGAERQRAGGAEAAWVAQCRSDRAWARAEDRRSANNRVVAVIVFSGAVIFFLFCLWLASP